MWLWWNDDTTFTNQQSVHVIVTAIWSAFSWNNSERLTVSEIKSVYKKFDKTLITNYRPISLLPVFSKTFENLIYKTLYYHLTSNNTLFKEQFGFRCNNSTAIAVCTLCNDAMSCLNDKIIVGGLFCDLQNALDCVNYGIILRKWNFMVYQVLQIS